MSSMHNTPFFSLAPIGGEGWGEGVFPQTHLLQANARVARPPHPDPLPQMGAREDFGFF